MSNLPDIYPIKDLNGFGVSYIVIATPDFPNKGAWWQVVDALNGNLVTYGWVDGIPGCMMKAANAGKRAAKYRLKKREEMMGRIHKDPTSGQVDWENNGD